MSEDADDAGIHDNSSADTATDDTNTDDTTADDSSAGTATDDDCSESENVFDKQQENIQLKFQSIMNDALNDLCSTHKNEINEIKENIVIQTAEIAELKEDSDRDKMTIASQRCSIEWSNLNAETYKKNFETANTTIENLRQQLTLNEEKFKQLEANYQVKEDSHNKALKSLRKRSRQLKNAQDKLEDYEKKCKDYEKRCQDLENEHKEAATQVKGRLILRPPVIAKEENHHFDFHDVPITTVLQHKLHLEFELWRLQCKSEIFDRLDLENLEIGFVAVSRHLRFGEYSYVSSFFDTVTDLFLEHGPSMCLKMDHVEGALQVLETRIREVLRKLFESNDDSKTTNEKEDQSFHVFSSRKRSNPSGNSLVTTLKYRKTRK